MLGHVRNRTDTGDTVKRAMGGDEAALQTAMPRDAAPLYAVEGCSAENLQFAGTLFEKWLKYDVTTPKVSQMPIPPAWYGTSYVRVRCVGVSCLGMCVSKILDSV